MTTAVDAYPVRGTGHIGRLILHLMGVLLRHGRRRYRIWQDRQHLHELPDYLLKDLAITRSEIDSVTEYGFSNWSRHQTLL